MGSPTIEGFHAFTAHADLVTISTGCRSNFIFDADLVAGAIPLSFNKTTATSYELRNYDGDVLKSGALVGGAAPTITDADLTWRGRGPYGWYRLYLFGSSVANWGTAYGDCTFYRVSDSTLFPANPASGTAASGTTAVDEIARGVMGFGTQRYSQGLATTQPWGTTKYSTASGTSVTVVPNSFGSGLHALFVHVFIGDPSELATPTTSGVQFTWTNEARITKNTVTTTIWRAAVGVGGSAGTVTLSSGSKSGTHHVYMMTVYQASWNVTHTPVTSSGTGTAATLTVPAMGYASGYQKTVFGVVATAAGVTFGNWQHNFTTTAWSRNPSGVKPTAPDSVMSVASRIYSSDASVTLDVAWSTSQDWVMIGMPVRAESVYTLPAAATTKTWWTDFELSNRPRRSVVLYADGSHDQLGLVEESVTALQSADVVFSPFNEPNFTYSAQDYVDLELRPFYETAKATDATCTVLGACPVSFNASGISFMTAFIAAGGLNYCDDIEVHPYNCFNGDMAMTRTNLQALRDKLDAAGFTGNLWQTEQGFAWLFQGQVMPRYSARWTAHMFMLCELYGISVERNYYWYDLSHGFDSFPTYWTSTFGPGPQALPIRTMVNEIGNRTLETELDFGEARNLYAGGTWVGDDGTRTVGFIAQSISQPDIRFYTTAASLTVVDCWGNTRTATPDADRVVTLTADEMPTWIRVPAATVCELIEADWVWGSNWASGVTATASFTGAVSIARVTDGVYQNQYTNSTSSLTAARAPFNDVADTPTFPATITLPLGAVLPIGRIAVVCPPPWQVLSAFLEFDVDYQNADDSWTTAETYTAPASTSFNFVSVGRCRSETFWSQRHSFVVELPTLPSAKAVRVVVRSISEGPHESSVWTNNGQITLTPKVMVQEIEVWSAPVNTAPPPKPAVFLMTAS